MLVQRASSFSICFDTRVVEYEVDEEPSVHSSINELPIIENEVLVASDNRAVLLIYE